MTKVNQTAYAEAAFKPFTPRTAMAEAARCLLCHDAPCSRECPAGTDPGRFIRSLRFRNIKGAAEVIRENNPLGGCCALVCPYDKLCEQGCSRTGIDQPIAIGRLQHFLVEQERELNMRILTPAAPNGKKVVCIGAGPASLSCAAFLAREGCAVTVLERAETPGGVLSHGILPSRLPQTVVDYDLELIRNLGVAFECGRDVSAAELPALAARYDAVFVGIGLWRSKRVNIPGTDLTGVTHALEYLKAARNGKFTQESRHVLVIGGGDVAMDCVSTARQLGADQAKIVYRRTMAEAPANREELNFVFGLGIPIFTEFAPAGILGENGRVTAMTFTGRDGSSSLTLKADKVIFAIGQEQEPDMAGIADAAPANVFFGGDFVNGGQTVVQAVAEGKEAARAIMQRLREHKE